MILYDCPHEQSNAMFHVIDHLVVNVGISQGHLFKLTCFND